MTSKLKCPFCQKELKHEKTTGIYCCPTIFIDCQLGLGTGAFGTEQLWQALIQAKQDLEIARKALEYVSNEEFLIPDGDFLEDYESMHKAIKQALEQIEHKG